MAAAHSSEFSSLASRRLSTQQCYIYIQSTDLSVQHMFVLFINGHFYTDGIYKSSCDRCGGPAGHMYVS
jgi:hypothetical protein